MESEAYRKDCVKDIKADFYEFIRRGATTSRAIAVDGEARVGGPSEGKDKECQPRSTRIRVEDLKKYGYTGGCPGCIWYNDKLGLHRGHTVKCRQRIEEALKETEDGKLGVEQAKERRARHEASGSFEELCRSVIEGDAR